MVGGALRDTEGMLREIEGALLEMEGEEKLASGLGRSARPLGRGNDGALKERDGEGAGELRNPLGRLRLRGDGRLGIEGALLMDEPRKLEGRVTWAA